MGIMYNASENYEGWLIENIVINIRKAVFFMMTRNADKKREQMLMLRMDDMVPQNHMVFMGRMECLAQRTKI